MSLAPGAAVLYDETARADTSCARICIFYPVPFDKLVAAVVSRGQAAQAGQEHGVRRRRGQLAHHRDGRDGKGHPQAVRKKVKAANLNLAAAQAGFEYAKANLEKARRLLHRADGHATAGKIIIDGNSAAALGCMFAGITVATWYPITPSSSLCETLADYMQDYRIEKDGKATFAIVQAEDELAAIGMAIGAGWAGARSMTSTAGPGISLMNEFIGLAYYAEIPVVIFDITRVGPSTGLPTRTQQSDILSTGSLLARRHKAHHAASLQRVGMLRHGGRCVRSDRTIPDADLRHDRSRSRHEQLDVGSVQVSRQEIRSRQGAQRRRPQKLGSFERYGDVDGDGIGYRTLPGTDHPAAAYFTRGSGHNEKRSTANGRTTTRTTWIGCEEVRNAREHSCRSRRSITKGRTRRSASSLRNNALGDHRIADQLQKEYGNAGQLLPSARGSIHKTSCRVLSKARSRLRRRTESRRPDGRADQTGTIAGAWRQRSEASGTTADFRSMRASLPTHCHCSMEGKQK